MTTKGSQWRERGDSGLSEKRESGPNNMAGIATTTKTTRGLKKRNQAASRWAMVVAREGRRARQAKTSS